MAQAMGAEVPLTAGRDLPVNTLWNAWTEVSGTRTTDERYGLSNRNTQGNLTLGLDRQITPDIVAGFSLGAQNNHGSGYHGNLRTDSDGVVLGPYAALRLSPAWAADASFSYTRLSSDAEISVLSGSATVQSYATTLGLSGQYVVNEWFIRPKLSVSYTVNDSDTRNMRGILAGVPIAITLPGGNSDYGLAEAYTEFSRLYALSNGLYLIPYLELGVHYEYKRANDGRIQTGDFSYATPSGWYGSVRTGVRAQLSNNVLLEGGVGYLSLGQNGRDVWEGKVRVSVGF